MPHAIIDYAEHIQDADGGELVKTVHRAMLDSGLFDPQGVKTRAHATADYAVGNAMARFVHVQVFLLEGRTDEQKKELSESILQALERLLPTVTQITVDVCDMNKACYAKRALV